MPSNAWLGRRCVIATAILVLFLRQRSHGNCQAPPRTTLATDLSRFQDDTGRGAGPFLGSPSPLPFRVHYVHTGRGAGPTPRAAPRSLARPRCVAPSRPSRRPRPHARPWPDRSARHASKGGTPPPA